MKVVTKRFENACRPYLETDISSLSWREKTVMQKCQSELTSEIGDDEIID